MDESRGQIEKCTMSIDFPPPPVEAAGTGSISIAEEESDVVASNEGRKGIGDLDKAGE